MRKFKDFILVTCHYLPDFEGFKRGIDGWGLQLKKSM